MYVKIFKACLGGIQGMTQEDTFHATKNEYVYTYINL